MSTVKRYKVYRGELHDDIEMVCAGDYDKLAAEVKALKKLNEQLSLGSEDLQRIGFALKARAKAAEARVKELEGALEAICSGDTSCDNGNPADRCAAFAESFLNPAALAAKEKP